MERIRRFYNQNRKKIHKWAIIIIVFLFITRSANYFYIEQAKKESENSKNENISLTEDEERRYAEDYKVSDSIDINDFISYCKNREYDKAYSMLSDDTKEEKLYSTEEAFINNFINAFIKSGDKIELKSIDAVNQLYLIEVYNSDILSTGNVDSIKSKSIKELNKKIVIKDYIAEEEINQKYINEKFDISIKRATLYKNYTELKIMFTNNTSNNLTIENTYLSTKDGSKIYQKDNGQILIKGNESKTLNIKYNLDFNTANRINKIVLTVDNEDIEITL